MEVEANNRLPYLDAMIRRNEDRLSTAVYRKPTDTGRYLSFKSNHPQSAKHSVVNALFSRAYTIVSEDEDRKAEIQLVTDTLLHTMTIHQTL